MARDQGRMERAYGKLFRERQIYHRSDGVVRFVKLSAKTQFALALVTGMALLWVAYASVNVVFKEQIIVSKDQERRDQEAAYRSRLERAENAIDQVTSMNYRYAREFDASISSLQQQQEALKSLMENKALIDSEIESLADTLSEVGEPGGRRPTDSSRFMVDPVGREPTPRQSRTSALHNQTMENLLTRYAAEFASRGAEDEVLLERRTETASFATQQVILMAQLEDKLRREILEADRILSHTGVDLSYLVDRHRTTLLAQAETSNPPLTGQGGPFIPVEGVADHYFEHAGRISTIVNEMTTLKETLKSIPLSSPIAVRHRMSSRFGVRWDPLLRNRRAAHKGLDFAAPRKSPLIATAPGRVSFAGVRNGFGKTVEIDHGNGFKTRFAHMNRISVRKGQRVKLHQNIGELGNTGRSSGPHVHYEIIFNGTQVDPLRFIEAGRYVFES